MESTALHTFLFHCPPALRSIVVLGSWDNFSRPYSLELDARQGRGIWKGCFTFSDIICDGNPSQQSTRRDGLLKMGGTYWYYFKVDGEEECHNPSEPSTTKCPLLPGQRLNVLDFPREQHGCSQSEASAFTRNPKDRYLTPVPPAPLKPQPSPWTESGISTSYSLAPPSPWAPKSATYPSTDQHLPSSMIRHARSASASPYVPSTPIFPDFKVLKGKLVSKRSATRIHSPAKSKELEIGSPVLISSTVDKDRLIPLAAYQSGKSGDVASVRLNKPTRSIPSIRKHFNPLASNPVDPIFDGHSEVSESPAHEQVLLRRRSHVPTAMVASEFKITEGRIRANSADTERNQRALFPNDPSISSPNTGMKPADSSKLAENDILKVPVLEPHASDLGLPEVCERPISRHENDCSTSAGESPLNKELPALPSHTMPAPLFACVEPFAEEIMAAELPRDESDGDMGLNEDIIDLYHHEPRSHFSTWSGDFPAYSPTTSDDEAIRSPTFSSFPSSFGDSQCIVTRYSYTSNSPPCHSERDSTLYERSDGIEEDVEKEVDDDLDRKAYLSLTPPQLESLRISRFGSDLFDLAAQPNDMATRRQATCFGLGFHYTLPQDETTSKTTITQSGMQCEPVVAGQRQSTISQLSMLLDEFAFLGDAVI